MRRRIVFPMLLVLAATLARGSSSTDPVLTPLMIVQKMERAQAAVSIPNHVKRDYRLSRDGLYQELKDNGIHPRRYFYPLISDFPMYRGLPSAHRDNLPVATATAQKILCLPIYPGLDPEAIQKVVRLIAAAR